MKNKIIDLNNHLFAQLERLSAEDLDQEQLRTEIERAKAISDISKNIIESQKVTLAVIKLAEQQGISMNEIETASLFLSADTSLKTRF